MLHFESLPMRCAELGTPNVLPDIRSLGGGNPPPARVDPGMPEEEGAWVHQGHVHTMLPYTMQDGYDRKLRDSSLRMAVLENEHLRAEFALDLGGRLWSLYSKTEGRELLFRNNVFRPSFLEYRDQRRPPSSTANSARRKSFSSTAILRVPSFRFRS